uniref:Uncharacterized protein n=1 Tax=viral metagenome TaxID=1070528 RepID=A0A6C0E5F2_9ZZZZ
MADPFNKLLDLVLEIYELNFSEFMGDGPVSGLKVEQMETRITGISNRIDTIIKRIKEITQDEAPDDPFIILAMVSILSRDITYIPGYHNYDEIVSRKRDIQGNLTSGLTDTCRLISIKRKLTDFCFDYYPGEDLEQQLTREQYNMLRQRQNESIDKGEAAAAAANAFLEGAADDNPQHAPPGYQPPPGSFRGDKFHEIVESDDLHKEVASYFGGKRKTKRKKQRNKITKRKTTLNKKKKTRRNTKR